MKSKLLLFTFLLLSAFSFAQDVQITGQVTEAATGMPIPGANVAVKNAAIAVATDLDGNYSIKVPKGGTLVFSFIGFETVEKTVTDSGKVTVALKETSKTLDEVVVIGYGSQKKKEITGAVSTVSAETLDKLRPVKVEQALQGTISGVNVTTTSGAPGAGLTVRIRGIGTNGDASPIAIIDGYQGDLSLLNPADIETVTVLKDAQAAIYGTIGANGVILITTKKGRKNQKPKLSFNTYAGFQETSRKLPVLNATEYAALVNEAYANNGDAVPYPNVSGLGKGTNWQNEVFGKSVPLVNHDFNLSGGSEKITYTVSGSNLDQKGIVSPDKAIFRRNTARIGFTADITDNLKFNTNLIYTAFNRKTISENRNGVLFNALNVPSTFTPYDANGDYTQVPTTGYGVELVNPIAQSDNTFNNYNYRKLNGTFGLDYTIIPGLTATARFGFNSANDDGKTFNKMVYYGDSKVFNQSRSSVNQSRTNNYDYTSDFYITYQKTFAEAHNLTATVGTTAYKTWGNFLSATGYDIPNNSWEFADISLANGLLDAKTTGSYAYDERRLSHFGRIQYDYKGRYLLSGMLRRDLSSRFGPNNRVGYFPSATAGWVVSNEQFYGNNSVMNFAKIRASYGTLGNDMIGNNQYLSVLGGEAVYVFNNQLTSGTATGVLANPNIKWEQAQKFDVGADLNFFNDKLTLVADYFIDTRKDLLIQGIPVSGILGVGAPGAQGPTANAGSVRNSGFELALGYKDKVGEDFSYNVNYNVTFLKNKVVAVNNSTGFIETGTFNNSETIARMQVGQPMGYFYGYQMDGIFQNQAEINAAPSQSGLGATTTAPGDIRYKDVNGDGKIDAKDRTNLGDPIPSATMGFNLTLNYKGFDFSAYTFASIGNDMVRAYERNVPLGNRMNYWLDRWTGEGSTNSMPRVTTGATNNNLFSSFFVEDASYLRIQNVQLGYTLNNEWVKKVASKVRLYVGANNLFTFTKYRGFDPGASSGSPIGSGIDYGFYPVARTYMVGANLNF
ncbi:SusC/RagA family TonB-linked outer membrane protein [Flavobacterium sp. RNTU_13]|uniref:SusC/RagA family TonB-linked outer membrane protein n=1 Tax=Flavobacterium sp. RNTU_13 TaxID=3375145 RepID=UPI0039858B12